MKKNSVLALMMVMAMMAGVVAPTTGKEIDKEWREQQGYSGLAQGTLKYEVGVDEEGTIGTVYDVGVALEADGDNVKASVQE